MISKRALLDAGTWSSSGVAAQGAWDAYQDDPERERRKEDAIARGFDVNENQVDMPKDVSSSIGEPGTIPRANKIAAEVQRLRELALGSAPTPSSALRKQAAALRKQAALGVPAIKAPAPTLKAPPAPRITPAKPTPIFDPRTDKPAGMNLTHGIQTVSNAADTGASYSSFSRRLQGSPT